MNLAAVVDAPAEPGTNRKGTPADGAWLHLLPAHARALVIGRIPADVLRHLADRVGRIDRSPSGHYDLVLVGRAQARRIRRQPDRGRALALHLAAGGQLCLLDGSGVVPPTGAQALALRLRQGRVVQAGPVPPVGGGPRRWSRDTGVLVGRDATGSVVPSHIAAAATAAGIDVGRHAFELTDTGRYRTKKLVMWLTGDPAVIVKSVRDPVDNPRIENERRMLTAVRDGVSWSTDVPEPLFWGHHRDRAFLGQRVLEGRLLNQTPTGNGWPLIGAALELATSLGIETHHLASTPSLDAQLRSLHRRFLALYRPSAERRTRLATEIDQLLELLPQLPLVIQHGDLGTWNLLVGPDGAIRPLDWESGDLDGLPLWDLYYLARSCAVHATPGRARHGSGRAYAVHLLGGGPLAQLQADLVRRYCDATGTPHVAAGPLLSSCWMHRAVKEAGRLPRHRLGRGTYVRLLWATLESPEAPGLRLLTGRPSCGS